MVTPMTRAHSVMTSVFFQPVHQQEITLLFDEGGLQLGQPAGKKLTDLLKNTHQLRGDTYTVSYSWKSFSTVPS